ncbi:MAG: hypothetical protein ACJ74G_17025 [Blastocatellia bacterium]
MSRHQLELIKWETHTYPGIGTDAQAVINEQVADDYDIFIGIMWARFGMPTGRAGSGTAEEFYRAYRRYQEHANHIRIMFYFKDAPVAPSDLDPEHLALIRAFQKDLGEKGTYYWTYTGRDEFAQLVRMHLGLQVQEWGKSWGIEPAKTLKPTTGQEMAEEKVAADNEPTLEEEGYLDLILSGQENFESMNGAMARMTNALQDLGKRTNERTEELNQARTPTGEVDLKQAKRVSNRVAEEMNNFAALMEVEFPIFANTFSSAIDDYTRAFTITKDLGMEKKEDVETVKGILKQFRSTILSTQSQMWSFRDTIANLPRATTMLNRARRRTLSILDKLDSEFTTALNLTSEMEKVFDQFTNE